MNKSKHCYKVVCLIVIAIYTATNGWAQPESEWESFALNVAAYDYEDMPVDPYPESNLFDGEIKTCWVCGSYINNNPAGTYVKMPPNDKVYLNIFTGYGKSRELFYKNARPKKIRLSVYATVHPEGYVTEIADGYEGLKYPREQIITLVDSFGIQTIELDFSRKELNEFSKQVYRQARSFFGPPLLDSCLIVKIDVLESLPGTKYDDICISELFLTGEDCTLNSSTPSTTIKNVYINQAENSLLADDNQNQGMVIYHDPQSVLQLIDVSADNKWAIVISMPAELGEGRVETYYQLINIPDRKTVNNEIEECRTNYLPGSELFFETYTDGQLMLKYRANDDEYYSVVLE
ncbi:MAG: hypothetical protein KBB20_04405 [Bacteroidales bacterium]|jgi:hypothetical protein|nr:hypothetical protein [Bacteroidales bacterium]OQC04055.1 MAG: hypothetical protein BWX77_00323 [Bacteroidetes bacterium ADurb.Bin090]HQM92399.1 hypothetical protein [Bacteroidales bacterium]